MLHTKKMRAAIAAAFPATLLIAATHAQAAPTVAFQAPRDGQTFSGIIQGTSCYSAVSGATAVGTTVAYYFDGKLVNTAGGSPWNCIIDARLQQNGAHTFKAVVTDGNGATGSQQITVNTTGSWLTPTATTTTPTPTPTPTPAPTPTPTPTSTSALPVPGTGPLNIWFKAPLASQTVSGVLQQGSCYINGTGVARVSFFVDGAALNTDTNMADGMSCVLDTTKLANGTHTLSAVATGTAGGTYNERIAINVQNATPTPSPTPTPAPTGGLPAPTSGPLDIWFKAPLANQTVSGQLSLANCYIKGTGVASVRFLLDGTALNTDTNMTDGMSCVLDTTKFANGAHTLSAIATGTAGGSYTEKVAINIQNTGTPTPTPTPTPPPSGLPSTGTKAIPTFESIGLYWSPGADPGAAGCTVRYRKASESTWKDGLAMWYDARNAECRGSLVHLASGTSYVVQLGLPGQSPSRELTASTWNEQFPIARTVVVPSQSTTLNITQGGSPGAYVLYTAAAGGSTIDVANNADYNVSISAPYVILRGFTLKNARINGVNVTSGTDVVIEGNDISGWGRSSGVMSAGGYMIGTNMDSGISARCSSTFTFERSVIQRNKIHDPRYGAQSWSEGHPSGPNAVFFSECGGNHVFRYNELWGSYGHKFMDAYGGEENFGLKGMPNSDSDLYGNRIQDTQDDAIESEGANRNVRIWGNYFNNTGTGVATTATSVGPIYIWRNVMNRSRNLELNTPDNDQRLYVFKSGQDSTYGNGRRYVFHNTILQTTQSGLAFPLGAGEGLSAPSDGAPMTNTISRNNIFHIWKTWWNSADAHGGGNDDFDYDLYNGNLVGVGSEPHGIVGTPVYASGNGPASDGGGMYQLDPSSPGYDRGVRIPNFNDAFTGSAPDMGAHEAGSPAMKFGVQ